MSLSGFLTSHTRSAPMVVFDGRAPITQPVWSLTVQNERKITAVDLFAGAGGLTEGLKKCGVSSVLANEIDLMASKTFATNHPNVPLLTRDIRRVRLSISLYYDSNYQ